MKKILFFVFCFLASSFSFATDFNLSGIYQGENLYVVNPFASTGVGFCVFQVTVNDQISTNDVNSSSIEIDFSQFQLNQGDELEIVIKHKDDCVPKIVNPNAIKPKSTFEIKNIEVVGGNTLRWTTVNENGQLLFTVEQFKWNKWKKIGEIEGKGTSQENKYSYPIELHSGENVFRVKQVDFSNVPRYSKEITYNSFADPVTFTPENPKTDITFSVETRYEIYDGYGKIVLQGKAKVLDISKLPKGTYYINFDSQTGEFTKK